MLSPAKIRATTARIATPSALAQHQPFQNRTIPRKTPTHLPYERSVGFASVQSLWAFNFGHPCPSLVKGRWLDGKAQALTLLHLLAIRPPFLYCKLFCRQDEGIVTPPSLRPSTKNSTPLNERGNCSGLSNCACSVGFASCETLCKHYHASLRLRSFGSARPCADSVRPPSCILARRACSVGFASCLVSRLGCHIVWQLSAADFKHPCLKLWASTIVHPCTTRKMRVLPPTNT